MADDVLDRVRKAEHRIALERRRGQQVPNDYERQRLSGLAWADELETWATALRLPAGGLTEYGEGAQHAREDLIARLRQTCGGDSDDQSRG